MKIAIVQLNSNDSLTDNLNAIEKMTVEAAARQPAIIFFPENAFYFRINKSENVQALDLNGPEVQKLKSLCSRHQVAVHFTSAVLDGEKIFNASVLIEKNQNLNILYRKVHLFDIALSGQAPIRESDVFAHGPDAHFFEFGGFKFGSSICYDIRFAELYSQYAKAEVDVILVPAAFLVKTGEAHWDVLLRARAIESQCYVVASAQSGVHKSVRSEQFRETYGHSCLVGPWGRIEHQLASGVGVIHCELSKEEILKVRQQIPMKSHRRSIFGIV